MARNRATRNDMMEDERTKNVRSTVQKMTGGTVRIVRSRNGRTIKKSTSLKKASISSTAVTRSSRRSGADAT